MDGQRFDELVRTLAAPTSRRRLLGGLAGLAAGLVGSRTVDAGQCPDGCPCRDRLTKCDGVCLNANRDEFNCGGCGVVCPVPDHGRAVCRQGVCDLNCDRGYRREGLACVPRRGCVDDGTACGEAVCGTAVNNCGETVTCGPLGGGCPDVDACTPGACVAGVCSAASACPADLACLQARDCTGYTCEDTGGCLGNCPCPLVGPFGCYSESVIDPDELIVCDESSGPI